MVAASHRQSNTLVVLAAADELALHWLSEDAASAGLRLSRFHEPDLGGALTAVAFEPAPQSAAGVPLSAQRAAGRLFAHLPLALSRRREVKP